MCGAHRSDINNPSFDVDGAARQFEVMQQLLARIRAADASEQKQLTKATGLKLTDSPMQQLSVDVYRQAPFDGFHQAVAGLAKRLLTTLVVCLKDAALDLLSLILRGFVLPANWSTFRPLTALASWSLQELQHFFMIAPLVLRGFLTDDKLTRTAVEWLQPAASSLSLVRCLCSIALTTWILALELWSSAVRERSAALGCRHSAVRAVACAGGC